MSLNICEDHDDAVCVWEYGRECPLCNVVKQVETLKETAEKEEGRMSDMIDENDSLKKRVDDLEQQIADAPTPP